MNVQHHLIPKIMLYELELGHDAVEATSNICCAKEVDKVDYGTITRCFKKFCSSCKNLDDRVRTGRAKAVGSKAIFWAIEVTLTSSTQRVSGELTTLQYTVVCYFHDLSKIIMPYQILPHVNRILHDF